MKEDLDAIYDPLCDIVFVVQNNAFDKTGIDMLKEAVEAISKHAKQSDYFKNKLKEDD